MRATERNLSHDEADKIELICKNIGQQTDYDWTKDMKKLSPGAKFILYEEVAARLPHYLSSSMHSKDKVSSKVILYKSCGHCSYLDITYDFTKYQAL